MSFAIYGESTGYVHLVSALTREKVIHLFLEDVKDVGVDIKAVYNIYAVEDSQEDKELEDFIEMVIKEASNVLQ